MITAAQYLYDMSPQLAMLASGTCFGTDSLAAVPFHSRLEMTIPSPAVSFRMLWEFEEFKQDFKAWTALLKEAVIDGRKVIAGIFTWRYRLGEQSGCFLITLYAGNRETK